jgi:hypothetical protein
MIYTITTTLQNINCTQQLFLRKAFISKQIFYKNDYANNFPFPKEDTKLLFLLN